MQSINHEQEKQFVLALIEKTKNEQLEWRIVPQEKFNNLLSNPQNIIKAYYCIYGDNIFVVGQKKYEKISKKKNEPYEGINTFISILDMEFKYLYEITDDNFAMWGSELFRLYKLVQRKVNNIDVIMKKVIFG